MIIIFPKYIHNRFSLCVIEKFYVIYSQIVNIINKVCWRSLFNKVLVLLILSNLWFCVVYQISQNSSWTLNYWTYLNQNWAVCTCHSYPALQPSSPPSFISSPVMSVYGHPNTFNWEFLWSEQNHRLWSIAEPEDVSKIAVLDPPFVEILQ